MKGTDASLAALMTPSSAVNRTLVDAEVASGVVSSFKERVVIRDHRLFAKTEAVLKTNLLPFPMLLTHLLFGPKIDDGRGSRGDLCSGQKSSISGFQFLLELIRCCSWAGGVRRRQSITKDVF